SSLRVHVAIAASGLPGDDGGRRQDEGGRRQDEGGRQQNDGSGHDGGQQDDGGGGIRAAGARRAELLAQVEREAGQQPWPQGLMALRPGALDRDDICILFTVEPPGAALLIAVLEGLDVVVDRYPEAVLAAADMLRQVRAGQAPGAAAYAY